MLHFWVSISVKGFCLIWTYYINESCSSKIMRLFSIHIEVGLPSFNLKKVFYNLISNYHGALVAGNRADFINLWESPSCFWKVHFFLFLCFHANLYKKNKAYTSLSPNFEWISTNFELFLLAVDFYGFNWFQTESIKNTSLNIDKSTGWVFSKEILKLLYIFHPAKKHDNSKLQHC